VGRCLGPHNRRGPCCSIGVTIFYKYWSSYTTVAQTFHFLLSKSSQSRVLAQPDQGCQHGGVWEDRYWLTITLRNNIRPSEREHSDNIELGSTSRSNLHGLNRVCTPLSFAVTRTQAWPLSRTKASCCFAHWSRNAQIRGPVNCHICLLADVRGGRNDYIAADSVSSGMSPLFWQLA
jgi:hypothetical protein